MNDITKTVVAAVVAAALTVGAFLVLNPTAPAPTTTQPNKPSYGALTGPDIPSDYLHWGSGAGVYTFSTRIPMAVGTTTPCAILAPAVGSSTLVAFTADFQQASTTQWELAQASTAFATTSRIGSLFSTTNLLQDVMVASTTSGGSNQLFGPAGYTQVPGLLSTSTNSWLVLKSGVPTTTNSPVGYCTATFRVI